MRKTLEINVSEEIKVRDCIILRFPRKGYRKFMTEIIQGWFPNLITRDAEYGVQKLRVIDKGKNEYHEIVTDLKNGEVIHDVHEKLNAHQRK